MFKGFWVEKAWDIWTVGKGKDVDIGVAYDMFRTDARLGEAHDFNTGDTLPKDYDWAGLSKEVAALTEKELTETYATWHEFVKIHYTHLCEAWVAEDKVTFEGYIKEFLG